MLLGTAAMMRSIGAVIAMTVASQLLFVQLIYPLLWSFPFPRDLARVILPALPETAIFLLTTWALLRFGHHLSLKEIGLAFDKSTLLEFLGFTLLGAIGVASLVLPLLLFAPGHYVPATAQIHGFPSWLFFLALLSLAAFAEELLVHGYAFQTLIQPFHLLGALVLMNGFFASLHLANRGANEYTISNTFLAGCVLGMLVILRRNLWASIAAHLGWNLGTCLLGVNLSGFHVQIVPYRFLWEGDPTWSGDTYGPEGSLPATILLCLLLFIQVQFYYRNRDPQPQPAAPSGDLS